MVANIPKAGVDSRSNEIPINPEIIEAPEIIIVSESAECVTQDIGSLTNFSTDSGSFLQLPSEDQLPAPNVQQAYAPKDSIPLQPIDMDVNGQEASLNLRYVLPFGHSYVSSAFSSLSILSQKFESKGRLTFHLNPI